MKKFYIFIFTIFISTYFYGQKVGDTSEVNQKTSVQNPDEIKDFKMFPNPVVNGKLYIYSFRNTTKKIQIYNILGKQIIATNLRGVELNVSKLDAGIYILKAFENGKTSTRKLVIK